MSEKAKFWNFYLVLYCVYNLHLWYQILLIQDIYSVHSGRSNLPHETLTILRNHEFSGRNLRGDNRKLV